MLDKALNYVFSEDPDFQGFLQTPQAKKVGRSNYVWLHGVVVGSHTPMDRHIFTELVGIQMLLMNTLEPLLRGDKLAPGTALCPFSPSPDDQGREGAGTPG